ncbi:MAG: hypothetical protein VKL39_15435, partial [Leptolyngbyaceae bacterium]|nr:hypothetical protein [Leptolyngbyaceae bacterium]
MEQAPTSMADDLMKRLPGHSNPFQMLLILEWILLGIAILTIFTPFRAPHPLRGLPPEVLIVLKLASLSIILILGGLGLRLPPASRWMQIFCIALGFGLSWLVVLLGGRGFG